jgi:hypothetical protein
MIRQFIRDTIADLAHAVARSGLAEENARLASRVKDLERTVNQNVEAGNTLMWERDDARKQRDDLRAKLEAAERENAKQLQAIRRLEGTLHSRDMEIVELQSAAERRSPVDREAAYTAAYAFFVDHWKGCNADRYSREIVDAILGAAKAEPEKLTKEGFVEILCKGAQKEATAEPTPAFAPAPTSEEPSADTLARIRTIITSSSSPTDASPRIYRLIAHDHATVVKRVGELENIKAQLCDDSVRRLEQVTKLTAEVASLSAPCPADGMSDLFIGEEVMRAYEDAPKYSALSAAGAKARELFARPAR